MALRLKLNLKRTLAACVALIGSSLASAAPSCDRNCLKGHMDAYMAALAKHDPAGLALAKAVRFTENGAEIPIGTGGLWITFNRQLTYRHDVIEPATGGIASYFAIIENKVMPFNDLLLVRLKVVRGRITEVETVVNRHTRTVDNMETISPSWLQDMEAIEPPQTRLTRAQMITATLGYMRSIAFHDGKLAPYARSCIRLENGNITAIGPDDVYPVKTKGQPPISTDTVPGYPEPAAPPKLMGVGCGDEQLGTTAYSFITGFRDARFPIVDVERQKVYSSFDFVRRGDVETWTYDGSTYPMWEAMRYPNEILNTEIFKFSNGQISRVEAVFTGPQAYLRGTGWPGGTPLVQRPRP
jgi:hypothetical protein